MDRIINAIDYIDESIVRFSEFEKLEHAKNAYFENVLHFKNSIVYELSRLAVFSGEQLTPLIECLDEVLLKKNKGGNNQEVYAATWPKHGMVIAKLTELRTVALNIKLSLVEKIIDFILFSKRELIIAIISTIFGALISGLIIKIFM